MRYFIRLSYKGTGYSGWQRQKNAVGIQQLIEDQLSPLLQRQVHLMGCGRTDAGVHAINYIAHIDLDREWPEEILYKINRLLPDAVAVRDIFPVGEDVHARFDAISRSYTYRLHSKKNPFRSEFSTFWPTLSNVRKEVFHEMAELYRSYKSFYPFCKTGSQNETVDCELFECYWNIDEEGDSWAFSIKANRFLRGMVRLMVGMTLRVGEGKEHIATVRHALDEQIRLVRSFSAPPQGLFFTGVQFPFYDSQNGILTENGENRLM